MDTTGFVGSFGCTALEEGMFPGVAVKPDTGDQVSATLPVVPIQTMVSQEHLEQDRYQHLCLTSAQL